MSDLPCLPDGWAWATVGELALSVRNGVFVSRPGRNPPGTRILRISAVRPNALDGEDVRYAHPEPAKADDYAIQEGDLLFTRYSGNPTYVGACASVGRLTERTLHPDKLIRVVVDRRAAMPRFVQYAVNGGLSRLEIERRLKTTAGQVGIAGSQLRTVPIPLAPLSEQKRIVAAIEEHLAHLDAAEAFVSFARQRLVALEQRLIDRSVEGESVHLRDLLAEPLRNGLSARAASNGSIRVVTLTAVTRAAFVEAHTKLIEPGARSTDDLWMEPGDILIQRSNTPELVGTAALFSGPDHWAIFPDLLIRVRVDETRADPSYVELVLRSTRLRRYFRRSAQGIAGSMPKISQPIVEAALIPLPPLGRQRSIMGRLSDDLTIARRMAAEVERTAARMRSLRRAVVLAAVSGNLVPQDPADEPASVMLERIQAQRTATTLARPALSTGSRRAKPAMVAAHLVSRKGPTNSEGENDR